MDTIDRTGRILAAVFVAWGFIASLVLHRWDTACWTLGILIWIRVEWEARKEIERYARIQKRLQDLLQLRLEVHGINPNVEDS